MKTVLITGSSAGIGKATAQYFAEQGWKVIATMRSPKNEQHLSSLLNVHLHQLDVTWSSDRVQGKINQLWQIHGPIDVLVNNAGIGIFGAFEAADFEQINKQFDTNVFGLMRVTKALLPHFRERRSGTIINLSSGVGRMGLPIQSLYNSTKFAIEGFTESLQYELKPFNITVRLVEPGNIRTNFFKSLSVTDDNQVDAYSSFQSKVLENHYALDAQGSSPELVAKVVYKAATQSCDKLRYPAGRDASIFLKIRKLLPDKLFFGLVRNQLGA